ncbi:MAG: menaquinone biosynthesis decarboxylase [Planctomycetota bacterium]|nr:menaquinone biosynthesis decarboxylase [Planctomycetota bacterium]
MAYDDLRQFISALEKAGELIRIPAEVDPVLEITEITDRVSKAKGPALLFENPKGSKMPVAINLFGTERRMKMALGCDRIEEVVERIQDLLSLSDRAPTSLLDKIKMLPRLKDLASFFPTVVKKGPCKEVIRTDNFSLLDLPVLKCWPEDGGRTITFPLVFTRNPDTGARNVGVYRMQIFDERTTAMHWQIHKHGAQHHRQSEGKSKRIEVACAIGSDPATCFSGIVPLPDDVDEMIFAGFLRSGPVRMVKCETVDLEVPANSEIVLEGYVDPGERRVEGPFGDHTGFYSLADDYPVFHTTAITHRKDPIYQTIIVGKPPMEDCYMGWAVERLFLPLVRKQLPEVIDMHMPFEGIFHNLLIVSIRKRYPGHARKVMHSFWGLGQAMLSKCIVVVDDDTDVHNVGEVVWKVLNHIDPERDIEFVHGPIDSLDHASRLPNYGSKMGIDGTKKLASEGFQRKWPDEILMTPEIRRRVEERWKEFGIPIPVTR